MDSRPRRKSANYEYASPPDPLRRTVLSQRRKELIIEFKNKDKMGTGCGAWLKRLHTHMVAVDKMVTVDDIERWIKLYPWIVDEKVATTPPPTAKSVQRTPSNSSKGKPSDASARKAKALSPSAMPTTTTISENSDESTPSSPISSNTTRKSKSPELSPVNSASSSSTSQIPPALPTTHITPSTIFTEVVLTENIEQKREPELKKPEATVTDSKEKTKTVGAAESTAVKRIAEDKDDPDRLKKFGTKVLWKNVILKEATKRAVAVTGEARAQIMCTIGFASGKPSKLKMMARYLRQKIDRMMLVQQ